MLRLVRRLLLREKRSSEALVDFMRSRGARIGENCYIFDPTHTSFDIKRLDQLAIGDCVRISSGVKITCHDYSWSSCVVAEKGIFPDPGGRVTIGSNVFIGFNAVILKGVKIGDNVIIGANTLVSKDIPSDSVVAGNPARVISSFEQYANKRKQLAWDSFVSHCNRVVDAYQRIPSLDDLAWFAVCVLPRTKDSWHRISKLPHKGIDIKSAKIAFFSSEPFFSSVQGYEAWAHEKYQL